MKRIIGIIILSIILIAPVNSFAQFDLGIKGGYGYNRYYFQRDLFEQGFLPVLNGGIVIQYLNEKKFGLQSSIELTQKGWVEKTLEGGNTQFKMDFIQFNFLSLLKFNSKKENGLFIKFGPYVASSFNSSYTNSGNVDSVIVDYESFSYNEIDFGLRVGLSYKFIIKNGSLQLEMLFAQGLAHVVERDAAGIFQSLNQSLFFNFAYTYSFRKKRNKINKEKD